MLPVQMIISWLLPRSHGMLSIDAAAILLSNMVLVRRVSCQYKLTTSSCKESTCYRMLDCHPQWLPPGFTILLFCVSQGGKDLPHIWGGGFSQQLPTKNSSRVEFGDLEGGGCGGPHHLHVCIFAHHRQLLQPLRVQPGREHRF